MHATSSFTTPGLLHLFLSEFDTREAILILTTSKTITVMINRHMNIRKISSKSQLLECK
jgi:hypothetical protein